MPRPRSAVAEPTIKIKTGSEMDIVVGILIRVYKKKWSKMATFSPRTGSRAKEVVSYTAHALVPIGVQAYLVIEMGVSRANN